MDDAAGHTAASTPMTAAAEEALGALKFDWGEAYLIGRDDQGNWWAARRDRTDGYLAASGPEELRAAIRADYELEPVPRDPPAGA